MSSTYRTILPILLAIFSVQFGKIRLKLGRFIKTKMLVEIKNFEIGFPNCGIQTHKDTKRVIYTPIK